MNGVFGVGPAFPPRSLLIEAGKKQIGLRQLSLRGRQLALALACMLFLLPGTASSHDASSYGGVFRSRDLGAAWLNADVGLFLNAALVIAVDPRDSSHLLVGTANLYGRLARLLDVEQQQRRRESVQRQRIFDTSLDLLLICDRHGIIK